MFTKRLIVNMNAKSCAWHEHDDVYVFIKMTNVNIYSKTYANHEHASKNSFTKYQNMNILTDMSVLSTVQTEALLASALTLPPLSGSLRPCFPF